MSHTSYFSGFNEIFPNMNLHIDTYMNILSRATFPRAPSYGGVRTWVEGSQMCGDRALAEASNLLGYKEYTKQDFGTNT